MPRSCGNRKLRSAFDTTGPTALARNRAGCEATVKLVGYKAMEVGYQMMVDRDEAMTPVRQVTARWLLGRAVLLTSGLGFPLTQGVIARFGRGGAVAAEGVSAGLLVRDFAMVAGGAPRRLRPFPAALLWLELGAAGLASIAGLAAIRRPRQSLNRTPAGVIEALRRGAVGLLFGLHTYRFWIYLQPDHGRRITPAGEVGGEGPR
jgi:hypothetical protein